MYVHIFNRKLCRLYSHMYMYEIYLSTIYVAILPFFDEIKQINSLHINLFYL